MKVITLTLFGLQPAEGNLLQPTDRPKWITANIYLDKWDNLTGFGYRTKGRAVYTVLATVQKHTRTEYGSHSPTVLGSFAI